MVSKTACPRRVRQSTLRDTSLGFASRRSLCRSDGVLAVSCGRDRALGPILDKICALFHHVLMMVLVSCDMEPQSLHLLADRPQRVDVESVDQPPVESG